MPTKKISRMPGRDSFPRSFGWRANHGLVQQQEGKKWADQARVTANGIGKQLKNTI